VVRRALGIPEDGFVVGDVCRPAPEKLDVLLWASAGRLLKEIPDIWVITQSYPDSAARKLQARLGDRYINLAPSFEPEAALQTMCAMDALTHFSSMGESFGMAIAEALKLGIPVVANLTPGLARNNAQYELLHRTGAGVIANDVQELVDALRKLRDDAGFRRSKVKLGQGLFDQGPTSPGAVFEDWKREITGTVDGSSSVTATMISEYIEEYEAYERQVGSRKLDPLTLRRSAWKIERRLLQSTRR
jgi:glycosyltransferase involved in cell wall biosynthesis